MLTDPGAVPRGNATKENIQLMGFEEGQVNIKKISKSFVFCLTMGPRVIIIIIGVFSSDKQ